MFHWKKKVNSVLGHQESDNASIWNDYTSVLPTLGCGYKMQRNNFWEFYYFTIFDKNFAKSKLSSVTQTTNEFYG